jgi:membrane protease YdiL (CAAX protease family)
MKTKSKFLSLSEILMVYFVMQAISITLRPTGIDQWQRQNLGWSYTGMLIFVGIPALLIWLTRRDWAEYGVSLTYWQTNLDIGIKAYLVRIIPYVFGVGGAMWLMLDRDKVSGGTFVAMMEVIGLAVMLWVLNHQKPMKSGRGNVIVTILLLFFPIGVAFAMNKLSVVIISTIFWQFVFSGFGEEFVWRGYVQSRLNQAFGRPMRMFGIQFGAGLIVASLLFGLLHAFNDYDPSIGFASLTWGSAMSSAVAGLMFGVIREKTGTLLAPGIAHGLPDAVGEALAKIFGWVL